MLGYGLCNNALAGLRAGRVRLVVPRAHDCITLLLGSKERYAHLFAKHPGTYWFSHGWIECHEKTGGERFEPMANSGLGPNLRAAYEELVARYGEDNAQYLTEFMQGWKQHYTHGALIEFEFDQDATLAEKVQAICRERGWEFRSVAGDLGLLQDGLDGRWDAQRFLVLEPGQRVRACYDDAILEAEPGDASPPAECRGTCS